MSQRFRGNFSQLDRPRLAFSLLILGFYLFYTISFIELTPYPGIAITSLGGGWQVNDSSQENIPVEVMLVQIADLTYEEYRQN